MKKFYGFLWSPSRDITGQQIETTTTTRFLLLSPAILPADMSTGTSVRLNVVANKLQKERRKRVMTILMIKRQRRKTRRQKERSRVLKLNQTTV
jgi:hypothetical protein